MARRYAHVWNRLAANEIVKIIIHEHAYKKTRAALWDEKYQHQKAREAVGLPGFGRMKIDVEKLDGNKMRLSISIPFSGDNL